MERRTLIGRLKDAKLYGILDMGYVERKDLETVAKELLEGGVGMLQFRAKGYGAEDVCRCFIVFCCCCCCCC